MGSVFCLYLWCYKGTTEGGHDIVAAMLLTPVMSARVLGGRRITVGMHAAVKKLQEEDKHLNGKLPNTSK